MQDREHQKLVRARFSEIAAKKITDQMTNIDVCPGGGKSRNVQLAIEELDKEELAGGLIWVTPRASLSHQAKRTFNKNNGPFQLKSVTKKLENSWGYITTYQRLISRNSRVYCQQIAEKMQKRPGMILLVLDELHHCTKDDRQAWTWGVESLKNYLKKRGICLHVMSMTGTLFRGDSQPILHIDYVGGEAISHIRYSLIKGREEGAVVPPELIYVDGPVVIRQPSGKEIAYKSMIEVPQTHRMRLRKAFLSGQITTRTSIPKVEDSRQFTALYLLNYAIKHFLQKRKSWAYPLQTILVASSASTALGYTSWLRTNYPDLKIGLSLSNEEASKWARRGFKSVKFPEIKLVDFNGQEHDLSETIVINQSCESKTTFLDDFQLYLNGMPTANYTQIEMKMKSKLSPLDLQEYENLSTGEKVISAFQSEPIEGENVIDVLVTVGKAYEGLDAPRCKHLICLTNQRSVPWLAQCFARAWRRDYELQKKGIIDQRCWIFAPRDKEMVDAVDRIVWDQNLTSTSINNSNTNERINDELEHELKDNNLKPEEVLTEDLQNDYKEFKKQLEEAKKAEIEFINKNNQIKKDIDSDEDQDENNTAVENDDSDKKEIRPSARAFSVVDRVIHAYVDDQSKKLLIIKDLSITPESMV